MNRAKSIVFVLVAAAALVAAGYLFSFTAKDDSVYRGEVTHETPANAPGWVDKGQTAEPDYSAADREAHNATPVAEPEPQAPPAPPAQKVVEEDPVVTLNFLELLTHELLKGYHPAAGGKYPYITASFRSLNARFGRALDGFAVSSDDIRASRLAVLDYVFTAEMLDKLTGLYMDLFVAHLTDTALMTERSYTLADHTTRTGALSPEETATMLELYARLAHRVAVVCKAMAEDPEITEAAARYLRATKAVDRANSALQDAMDRKNGTAQAGERLKQAIMQREQHKRQAVSILARTCPSCSTADLFALAQWATRRAMENPKKLDALPEASAMLDKLAAALTTRAAEVKAEQPAG